VTDDRSEEDVDASPDREYIDAFTPVKPAGIDETVPMERLGSQEDAEKRSRVHTLLVKRRKAIAGSGVAVVVLASVLSVGLAYGQGGHPGAAVPAISTGVPLSGGAASFTAGAAQPSGPGQGIVPPAGQKASASAADRPAGAKLSPVQTATASAGPTPSSSRASSVPSKGSPPSATPSPGPFAISGQIACLSGNSVEGVWVAAAKGAGYSPWQGHGSGSTTTFSFNYTLPLSEAYSLHVGCGGTTASWAVACDSVTVTSAENSFVCDDVAGQAGYGTCQAG